MLISDVCGLLIAFPVLVVDVQRDFLLWTIPVNIGIYWLGNSYVGFVCCIFSLLLLLWVSHATEWEKYGPCIVSDMNI